MAAGGVASATALLWCESADKLPASTTSPVYVQHGLSLKTTWWVLQA